MSGTRIGAALVLGGLALAGPQALAVSWADDGDGGTAVTRSTAVERKAPLSRGAHPAPARSVATDSGSRSGDGAVGRDAAAAVRPLPVSAAARSPHRVVPARTPTVIVPLPDRVVPAATVVSPVRSGATEFTVPARTAQAASIAPVAAAVDRLFDAVANWLSSLPANPISGVIEGALLMVRRGLFNQSPTAEPVQWAQTTTDIVGTVGATDPEGDPIVYTVLNQPRHGTVEIDSATGAYTYTPTAFDSYGGIDEFTVQLSDTGAHLHLLHDATTDVTVPIVISGVDNLQGYTRGFDLYNLTSKTLVYFINDRGTPDSGPSYGTQFKPGEKAHFEVTYYVFKQNIVRVGFKASDESGIWAVDMFVADNLIGSTATQSCYASGSNKCNDQPFGSTYLDGGGNQAFFLDPLNTVYDIAGSDRQAQADRLNGLCFSGSVATCTFTVNKAKTDPGGPLSTKFSNPVLAAPTYTNNTGREQVWTSSTSVAQTTETNWSISANVKLTLIDKVLDASLTGTYGQRWATTTTFTNSYTTTVPDGKTAYLYQRNPVRAAIGDFNVKMGNTTWKLTDVEFVYPDPARQPNVVATLAPIS